MLRKIINYFMLFLSLSLIVPLYSFSGGDGSSGNPYQVSSCDDLQNISNYLYSNFTQISDVDCGVIPYNVSPGFNPIGNCTGNCWGLDDDKFTGFFRGNNYDIFNLFINRSTEHNVGLFGVSENTNFSNINLINYEIYGNSSTGALIGHAYNVSITNTNSKGEILSTGSYAGGIVGNLFDGNINESYSISNVSGIDMVGGLVGYFYQSDITNSYTISTILGNDEVGGLAGHSYRSSNVINSYSISNVTGNNNVGGLMGWNYKTHIINSYAISTVSGSDSVGGLLGYSYKANVINSYAISNVSGIDMVGGLVGYAYTYSISSSNFKGNVSGNNYVGGLVGYDYTVDITNSYSEANVSGNDFVGGLVGHLHRVDVINSYSNANIIGNNSVGGFIGECTYYSSNGPFQIKNSYSISNIVANNKVGGFIGEIKNNRQISNSFSISNITSTNLSSTGGFLGSNPSASTTDPVIVNSSWLNITGGPDSFFGFNTDTILTNNGAQTEENYYYNSSNFPMNLWNTFIWEFGGNSLPYLISENSVEPVIPIAVSIASLPSFGISSILIVFGLIGLFLF